MSTPAPVAGAPRPLSVLVVDDTPTDAELLMHELAAAGYSPDWKRVADAAAMRAELTEGAWDLIVSDYAMPGFSGMEALEIFKRSELDIPFLLVSGNVDEEVAVEAMRAGAHDYLAKDRLARLGPAVTRELREAALRRDRRRGAEQLRVLSLAVQQAPVSIVLTDTMGNIRYVNPQFTAVTGYKAAEVLGHNASLLKSGYTPASEYARLWSAITGGRLWHGQFCNRRKDGSLFWESVSISPIRDDEGRIVNFLAVKEDITERRRSYETIVEQAALLDRANDAIYVRGIDHTISYWNQGAERLYGWTAGEVIGLKTTDLFSRDLANLQTVQTALLEEGSWSGERQHLTKAGVTVVTFCRLTLMRDAEGRPKSVFAINTDITEKKQLEVQFLRAQRLESLGALASGIAHDLNNVLAPIIMGAPLLRECATDGSSAKLLETMEESAKRGAGIVKQVLTFARGVVSERVAIQPRHFIRDMSKIATETFPKSIRIQPQAATDLWPIIGDPTQLHQTLMNLCVNARDAMPEGGILTISGENVIAPEHGARLVVGLRPGPYVRLCVCDTGTGIAPEVLDRIFEPFFTTKEPGHGTGLGLSTVMGIVKNHGGVVEVKSELGKGTRFEVYLPATPDVSVDGPLPVSRNLPKANGELVLVADDEQGVRDVTRRVLEAHGHRVLLAVDGVDAVALYMRHRTEIRAVVTDMMMPGVDGASLVCILRRVDPLVPVIGMSGIGDPAQLAELESLALPVLLQKPFPPEKLLEALHETIHAFGRPGGSGRGK